MTQAQADFVGCLLTAAMTALPVFLQAFMGCITNSNPPDPEEPYKPGTRERCGQ